jgi:uncharacterized protein GlcG (DUF336 family)
MAHLRDARILTLEAAKAAAAAGEAYATERGWTVAIAVVSPSGDLLLFHRIDGTQPASQDIAILKARTAARLHRPTKALEDTVAGGRLSLLSLRDVVLLEGGIPARSGGQIVGAIGVSGMQSSQDSEVATAALGALEL